MMRILLLLLIAAVPVWAGPRALAVVAHPDDEVAFAATAYAMVHELGGTFDVVMITNGEGGYKYATLAEPIYHLELTREAVGRAHLPTIRRQEALEGGKVLGIRHYYFLDQQDWRYTQDLAEPLEIWDLAAIEGSLDQLVEQYDFIFVLLPTEETHGHHKAASLLALQAAAGLPADRRPAVLGATFEEVDYRGLPEQPLTDPSQPTPIAAFDRMQSFGYRERMNYQIVVNWFLAEHKSQGSAQLLANRFEREYFYSFTLNSPTAIKAAEELFTQLNRQDAGKR